MKKFLLLLALFLVISAVLCGYVLWTFPPTTWDVLGRTPNRPAPLDTPVSIDDKTVTVTHFTGQVTHRSAGGTDLYRTLIVRFSVKCDKAPDERCGTRTRFWIHLPEGDGFDETRYNLRGDTAEIDAGLQGGESVDIILSSSAQINSKRKLSGARLTFVSGRHQAYFSLDS